MGFKMWPGLVKTAKEGGVDVVETYVFWNGHKPSPGNYYFGGRYDLPKFVKIVQDAGMLLILRIGPFVAAEWNFGGIPVWLHYVPRTVFRTDNEPFKHYMQNFTTLIVNMMKKDKFFASERGPIILAQLSLISTLKNEHFVELLGYCLEGNNQILIYQYATMGSLHDVLHGRKGAQGAEPGLVLGWTQRVKIAYGTARGLDYLHEKVQPSIVHRDVRSSSVLLFDDC